MTPVTTLSHETIDRLRASLSVRGQSVHTLKAYSGDLRTFLLETNLTEVPREIYEETAMGWLTSNRRIVAPKTTSRRLTSLRAFPRWADWPAMLADYSAPTAARAMPHPLPEGVEGVRRLIDCARAENQRSLIALCGLCGCRVGEALSIRPSHFDMTNMLLTIPGKGEKTRIVPVSNFAWEVLATPVGRAFIEGDREVVGLRDRFARRVITTLGERAGLKRAISSHDLRATFATEAYNLTKDIRAVQELLGHATSKQTEVYTLASLEAMRQAVEF